MSRLKIDAFITRSVGILIPAVAGALAVGPAATFAEEHGIEHRWTNPAGGSFGDPAHWDQPTHPTGDDHAIFELPDTYTVTLDDDHTSDQLSVTDGHLTVDLNAHEYTLTQTSSSTSVVVGDNGGELTLTGAGEVLSRSAIVGVDGAGAINLRDRATWRFGKGDAGGSVSIGHDATGDLTLESGARMLPTEVPEVHYDATLAVGWYQDPSLFGGLSTSSVDHPSTLTVRGTDVEGNPSRVETSRLVVRFGELLIDDGGQLATVGTAFNHPLHIQPREDENASLTVTGTDDQGNPSRVDVQGSISFGASDSGHGTINVAAGAHMTSTRWMSVTPAEGHTAIANVTGPGSTLTIGEAIGVGRFESPGRPGELNIDDQARVWTLRGVTVYDNNHVAVTTGGAMAAGQSANHTLQELAGDTIHVFDGGMLAGNGTFTADTIENIEGTVTVFNDDRELGQRLKFVGDYHQHGDGSFAVRIGPGDQSDRLKVEGDIRFGGTLDLFAYDNFTPTVGDTFNILEWTGQRLDNSTFDSIVHDFNLAADTYWDTAELYTDGTITLVPEPGTGGVAMLAASSLLMRRRPRRA